VSTYSLSTVRRTHSGDVDNPVTTCERAPIVANDVDVAAAISDDVGARPKKSVYAADTNA
jgi:hypothetical protein